MHFKRSARTSNALEHADSRAVAIPMNRRPNALRLNLLRGGARRFSGSVAMSDAIRNIVWISSVAFGVVTPGAFAQDERDAGDAQVNPAFLKLDTNHDGFISRAEKDLAADRPDSVQKKYDEAALRFEEEQLKAAKAKLIADTKEGRMAAESRDAERVSQDWHAVKGEQKDFLMDAAKLQADRKG